jgi:murein L,D-transpeptidase YafK
MTQSTFYSLFFVAIVIAAIWGLHKVTAPLVHETISVANAEQTGDTDDPSVFVGPPPLPNLPHGCVETVEDLSGPSYLNLEDERLYGDDPIIVVLKRERRLMLFSNGSIRRSDRTEMRASCWRVALGATDDGIHPTGRKLLKGDRKTPEGWYRTSDRPWSKFNGGISIHYPNERDAAWGLRSTYTTEDGEVRSWISQEQHDLIVSQTRRHQLPTNDTKLGGNIVLHGDSDDYDWTWGCVALAYQNKLLVREVLEEQGFRTWILILP